jgi:hypothetical protein
MRYKKVAGFNYRKSVEVAFYSDCKIYLIMKKHIEAYDTFLNKLFTIPLKHKVSIDPISQFLVHKNELYYYDLSLDKVRKISLNYIDKNLFERSDSNIESYDDTSYIYTLPYNFKSFIIDLNRMTAKKINIKFDLCDVYNICELPQSKILLKSKFKTLVYEISASKCRELPRMADGYTAHCMIYHQGCIYAFTSSAIFKLEIRHRIGTQLLKYIDIKRNLSEASCVALGDRIYIIGGDEASVYIYNIEVNEYYRSEAKLLDKLAVCKVIDQKIYIIYCSSYQIFDNELRLLEEGRIEYDRKIEGSSTVGFYNGKIYYINNRSFMADYYDIRSHKRGSKLIEFTD